MVDDVFAEAVRTAVEDRVGWKTMIIPVTKNNGLRLTGITVNRTRVRSGEAGDGEIGDARNVRNIEPNFYLDNIPKDKRTDEYVDTCKKQDIGTVYH